MSGHMIKGRICLLLGALALGAQAGPTAVEQRVDRARSYAQRGEGYVAKANKARKTKRLSESSRESLYRANLARAASALRRARSLVRGRKDPLSITADAAIVRSLVKVLNSQARAYLEKDSLARAGNLAKDALKLHPGNATARGIQRNIKRAKRRASSANRGSGGRGGSGSVASRRWRARRAGTGAGGAGTRGGGGRR